MKLRCNGLMTKRMCVAPAPLYASVGRSTAGDCRFRHCALRNIALGRATDR
jgi:hypothetical protein